MDPLSTQDQFVFNTMEDYVLEDERVILRPLLSSDFPHLMHFGESEPEIWVYSLYSAAGLEGMTRYLNEALENRQKEIEYPFIVYDKRSNQYAGSTRFYDIQLGHKTIQLGYTWYGKAFQGTGLNAHCKYLMLQFAFEKMGMERVEFRADNNNERSKAAMKKIGCTSEGILRSNYQTHSGRRRDSVILSILNDEWFGRVKPLLEEQRLHP
ncbi:MAG: GNAT family protein [Saprospiraceae bacterium]